MDPTPRSPKRLLFKKGKSNCIIRKTHPIHYFEKTKTTYPHPILTSKTSAADIKKELDATKGANHLRLYQKYQIALQREARGSYEDAFKKQIMEPLYEF
jgi:hypothetical protein